MKNQIKMIPFDRTDILDELLEELMDAGIVVKDQLTGDLLIDSRYLKEEPHD